MEDEDHEYQFNPQRAFPGFAEVGACRGPANEATAGLRGVRDIAFGEHKLRRLDLFLPEPGAAPAPLHVYIHGGYWRAQDKANFRFVAPCLVERGVAVAVMNYELCPDATLDGVVDSALEALVWLAAHAAEHGADPRRISLSGHSAGAHLAAEMLAADLRGRGLDPASITGAVLISGIFDPAPAIRTTVNAMLNLTPEIAERRNVLLRPPLARCPVWLFVGGLEPWRWIAQTFDYALHLHRHGLDPAVQVLPGLGHFDIIDGYAEPGSPILEAALQSTGG